MNLPEQVARVQARIDTHNRAAEFVNYAKYLMLARGSVFAALKTAEHNKALPRIVECLKAATTSGTTTDAIWAAPLAPYGQMVDGFLSGLVNAGAFDQMLPYMRVFPLHEQISAVTVVASAAVVPEGSSKPTSRLTVVNGTLQEKKAVAIFAVSMELLRMGGPGVTRLLQTELTNGVALATDTEFLSVLRSGITAIPSSGSTALGVRADLRALLAAVSTDKNSRLFLLMQPSTAEQLSIMADSAGGQAFAGMTPTGGQLSGIVAVTTDAAAAGEILLVDAPQICVGQQNIVLDATQEALIQLSDTPDSPPIVSSLFTSLWQSDAAALRATRGFGALRLRSTAVAVLSGASYLGNSPA